MTHVSILNPDGSRQDAVVVGLAVGTVRIACQQLPRLADRVAVEFCSEGTGGLSLAGAVRQIYRLRTREGERAGFVVRIDSVSDLPGPIQALGPQRAAVVAC